MIFELVLEMREDAFKVFNVAAVYDRRWLPIPLDHEEISVPGHPWIRDCGTIGQPRCYRFQSVDRK
jgi:hypothetical protein